MGTSARLSMKLTFHFGQSPPVTLTLGKADVKTKNRRHEEPDSSMLNLVIGVWLGHTTDKAF